MAAGTLPEVEVAHGGKHIIRKYKKVSNAKGVKKKKVKKRKEKKRKRLKKKRKRQRNRK